MPNVAGSPRPKIPEVDRSARPTPRSRTPWRVLALRALIVVIAGFGWGFAMIDDGRFLGEDWVYFSQLSDLAVGLTALASVATLGRADRWLTPLRGAVVSYDLVTLLIYATLLGADYSSVASSLEHLALPILALVDWVLTGRKVRLRWFWPAVWLSPPLIYLPLYVHASRARAQPLYDFLDPAAADFGTWVVILLVVFLLLQGLVWATRLPGRRGRIRV